MSTTKIVTAAAVIALVGLAGYQFAVIQRSKESAAALDQGRARMAKDIATSQHELDAAKANRPAPPIDSAATVASPKASAIASNTNLDATTRVSADSQKPSLRLSPDETRVLAVALTVKAATDRYRAAHNGQEVPNLQALIPYFATPQEGADYVEFLEAQNEAAKKGAKRD